MPKTPPGDFKITAPENPLLSKQTVTSKEILVPSTHLQLNPYPNTQLDLFCSDNLISVAFSYLVIYLCYHSYCMLIELIN